MAKRTKSQVARSNVRNSKVHERKVAELFSTWTGRKFRRRRVEGHDIDTVKVEHCGDVIPVEGDICLSIEAKSGKKFSLNALLTSTRTALFTKWWAQACYDAALVSGIQERQVFPILLFKPNVGHHWVACSSNAFEILEYRNPDMLKLTFDGFSTLGSVFGAPFGDKQQMALDNCIITNWDNFSESVNPESIFVNQLATPVEISNVY